MVKRKGGLGKAVEEFLGTESDTARSEVSARAVPSLFFCFAVFYDCRAAALSLLSPSLWDVLKF
jgi:hypothetical protein